MAQSIEDMLVENHSQSQSFDQKLSNLDEKMAQLLSAIGNGGPPNQHTTPNPAMYNPYATSMLNSLNGTPFTPNQVWQIFPWVEESHLSNIAQGKFDFNHLPKLLRDNDKRKKFVADSVQGLMTDLQTGKQSVLMGETKLQSTITDQNVFVAAFTIYAAIRMTYVPEYGPALCAWIEQILFHASYAHWSDTLKYATDYFRIHQSHPPEEWLKFDTHLISVHFTHAVARRATARVNTKSTSVTKWSLQAQSKKQSNFSSAIPRPADARNGNAKEMPLHLQYCLNYNKFKGCNFSQTNGGKPCGRVHGCWSCTERGHSTFQCPKGPKTVPGDTPPLGWGPSSA